MFWKRKRQVPWDEVGTELGKSVVIDAEKLSQQIKEALQGQKEPGLPDFDSKKWLYELCQWKMFWVWYVANFDPKLKKEGATKPWLDAYHKSAYRAMAQAGLVGTEKFEQVQAWEMESEKRFYVYQRAHEHPPPKPMIFTATLGWEFARFLYPAEEPNPKLAMLMNLNASIEYIGLAKMVESLEKTYGH